ncbi:DUF6079 family protein [Kyrpidia tusciae]|uniref:DUF6079 family protein n=1 Tax=Kyrpidia tusciae TaxID=33943 RepID=UPI0024789850|nr:DUF6079 family protein [Kyrpidia tusciae]
METVLREILKTVSWQYISFNEQNGQYYLDLKKDVAVDDLIEQRAETLMPHDLDQYYFEALALVTESASNTYISGYKIWQHELPWWERRVMRQGYLFFGAPVDRSTAQPPRDFYIYMLQPFDPPKFKDEERPDEVFFVLKEKDEDFLGALSSYAAARKLSANAAAGTKHLYEEKAQEYLRQITRWLRENWQRAFDVTHRGSTKKISRWLAGLPPHASVREIIDRVASSCLAPYFEEKYPDYPAFTKLNTPLTPQNLPVYVQDALRSIAGNTTKSGIALLDGLVLMDGEKVSVRRSGYAGWVLDELEKKGPGQVINRSEMIERVSIGQGPEEVERTTAFGMEPELLVVVLAALVYHGEILLTVSGTTYDAMRYDQLIKLPLEELKQFSHLKRPSEIPWASLQALFDVLDIQRGLLQESALQHGIVEMNRRARGYLDETVRMLEVVRGGIPVWEGPLLTASQKQEYRDRLERLRTFLEQVLIYDTPAKLRNFKFRVEEVEQQKQALLLIQDLKELQQRAAELTQLGTYLLTAQQQLPEDHAWRQEAGQALAALLRALRQGQTASAEVRHIQSLKAQYQDLYLQLHHQARLNMSEESKRQELLSAPHFAALQTLSAIELLPESQLQQWQKSLRALRTCAALSKADLAHHPVCPHCRFRPRDERLAKVELSTWQDQLYELFTQWTQMLLDNLNRQEVQAGMVLLAEEQQALLRQFMEKKVLSLPVEPAFVEAVRLLLKGIERVEVTVEELKDMVGGGNPLTVDELRTRFERLLRERLRPYPDPQRVRIMLRAKQE